MFVVYWSSLIVIETTNIRLEYDQNTSNKKILEVFWMSLEATLNHLF